MCYTSEKTAVIAFEFVGISCHVGARADKTHLPCKYIEQLREFIKT